MIEPPPKSRSRALDDEERAPEKRLSDEKDVIITAVMMVAAGLASADNLVVTSFHGNGQVTWTFPTNGVAEYRVEWCADLLAELWCDLESGLRGIAPIDDTMNESVPMSYRIKAMGPEPTNMVYIPAGWFDMGNCMDPNEGRDDELPVHRVYVSGFYMDRYEVNGNLWGEVYAHALTNGYSFDNTGAAKGTNHPVHTVNWYDVVKWANARSQIEGLTPCYYLDDAHTILFKTGTENLSSSQVNWTATGYRLPTEAEWEKAARGGASGHRFPWADDTISHGRANYTADSSYSYDLSNGLHPDYSSGDIPYTSPIGSFTPNGHGLYDMAGNAYEWCWDRYDKNYYSVSPSANPVGPLTNMPRVLRGGDYHNLPDLCRSSYRYSAQPNIEFYYMSFRLVRAAP